jgi:hypothetical protein
MKYTCPHEYGVKILRRTAFLIVIALCTVCAPAALRAQGARAEWSEVFRQLLRNPAPPPNSTVRQDEEKLVTERKARTPDFFDAAHQPPDDAPDDDLFDYWWRYAASHGSGGPRPTDAVRQRLLAACEAEPERLQAFLSLMPDDEQSAERVKKLYDAAQDPERFDEYWRKNVRDWLKFNSKYFLDELNALARKARDKDGYVENEDALKALAKVDAEGAHVFLLNLASNVAQPRTAVLATTLLYAGARASKDSSSEEKYRARLRAVAADRRAPAAARDTAIVTLSNTDWQGRDDWYLSLFADETLPHLSDGSFGFNPLTTLFVSDPEKWIPVMTKLVEGKDRTVRSAAASCLIVFQNRNARKDALRPLVPWLANPDWAEDDGDDRLRLIQSMEEVEIPESVPGLIWVVEHDEDESNRSYAAESLSKYKDPRAAPALKKALAAERDENHRGRLLQGLIACGGMPEAEQLAALEIYATKLTTPEGRENVERYRFGDDDALPLNVYIGKYLASEKDAPESLAREVIARADALRPRNAPLARALIEIAEGWNARACDLDMLRRIAAGTADAATISNALARRDKLRESVGQELRTLSASGGAAQGVAAVLLDDEAFTLGALSSDDARTQVALLVCARLTQTPLPVAQVGALLSSKDALVALAAERYLLAEDSRDARRLLLERHPNEAFITGWRENASFIGGNNFDDIDKAEEKLRAELLREGGPREIYALFANRVRPFHVVRVYADRVVHTFYETDARLRERVVKDEELARFKSFVAEAGLADSGPQFGLCHYDCAAAEFLSLALAGGHRVFAHQGAFAWINVWENFAALGRGEGVRIRYDLEDEIKGLEILLADDHLKAKDVWQRGTDLRVLVEREETAEESEQRQKLNGSDDDSDADEDEEPDEQTQKEARAEQQRRLNALTRARSSWRAFADGKLGADVSLPDVYSTFDPEAFADEDMPAHLNERMAQAVAGDSVVMAGGMGEGLWKKSAGQRAVRVSEEGSYANPVVAPGGRWVVAAKTDTDWGDANYVVRFDLRTGREFRVELPAAEDFEPVAYLPAHGRVLLRRARDENSGARKQVGPETAEFYLLDAATGRVELVKGDFAPIEQQGQRPLQTAGAPTQFWAAVPDRAKDQTRVGRYDIKGFSFQTLLVVPHIRFDSNEMWVDEAASKLYVVYEGQLLRLPLSVAATRK